MGWWCYNSLKAASGGHVWKTLTPRFSTHEVKLETVAIWDFVMILSQSPNLWIQADYVHPLLPPKSWAGTGIAIIPSRCLQVQKWKWQPQRSATSKLDLRDVLSPGWDLPRSLLVTDQWPLMSGLSHDVTLRYWWSVSVTHRVLANSTTSRLKPYHKSTI